MINYFPRSNQLPTETQASERAQNPRSARTGSCLPGPGPITSQFAPRRTHARERVSAAARKRLLRWGLRDGLGCSHIEQDHRVVVRGFMPW